MSRGFALKDLYDLISINAGIAPKTAERVWKTAIDVIISELQYNGRIAIDNFGAFEQFSEGGKDEVFTNELGITEKRYVPPIMNIKFKPSRNFVNRLNNYELDKFDKLEPNDPFFEYGDVIVSKDLEKQLGEQIEKQLQMKRERREKQRIREKELYIPQRKGEIPKSGKNIFKGKPIKCITINKAFPSMSNCAKELNLRVNNIRAVLDKDQDVYGYKFISLTDSEYEKEFEKVELMRERNENANI